MKASLVALLPVLWSTPVLAQAVDDSQHNMPPPAPAKSADPHTGHDMSSIGAMTAPAAREPEPAAPMMGAPPVAEHQTKPPAPPTDHLADQIYDPAAMAQARQVLAQEHGGAQVSKVMASLLERQIRSGSDGYRWESEAWFGGDLNRLVIKSKGEGDRQGVEAGEVQLLYSRAVAAYTDLQLGVRQDLEPKTRTYASVGFETLLPYWVEASGAVFLSDKGDVLARVEAAHDLRLTQRLILQPRAELNFAAQDSAATGTGSGLSTAELGLRLRYEVRREWAPYVGVSCERSVGGTADFARAAGREVSSTSFVVGLRAWF